MQRGKERLIFLCRLTDTTPSPNTGGQCFNELPVIVKAEEGNKNMYVKPMNRILTTAPTVVACNDLLPVKFFLDKNSAICQGSNGLYICNSSSIIDPGKGLEKAKLETLTESESKPGTTTLVSKILEIIEG